MKEIIKKIMNWILFWIGLLSILWIVHAWDGLTASTWDNLTADKWNQLVNKTSPTIYNLWWVNSTSVSIPSVGGWATWSDFPDLSKTFTVSDTTATMVRYKISMEWNSGYMVTRIVVDWSTMSRSITWNTAYWAEDDSWYWELSPGEHTIKVQYRTNQSVTNNPAVSDHHNRSMQILLFGS